MKPQGAAEMGPHSGPKGTKKGRNAMKTINCGTDRSEKRGRERAGLSLGGTPFPPHRRIIINN